MKIFGGGYFLSKLKSVLWRAKGHEVSLHAHVAGVCIRGVGHVEIKDKVVVRTGCIINLSEGAEVIIGQETFLNDRCLINARGKIAIGDRVQIGQNVCMYDHDHDYRNIHTMRYLFKTEEISIGNDVWIGSNVTILRGTTIGDRCVIGAGAVLKGNIPSDTMVYTDRKMVMKTLNREER